MNDVNLDNCGWISGSAGYWSLVIDRLSVSRKPTTRKQQVEITREVPQGFDTVLRALATAYGPEFQGSCTGSHTAVSPGMQAQ